MDQREIRDTVILSIFGEDELYDKLTLKGGNALAVQGVNTRASQDIDLSISNNISMDEKTYKPIFQKTLEEGFLERGLKIINFSFKAKPRSKNEIVQAHNDNPKNFNKIVWGGYHIKFGIMELSKYEKLKKQNIKNLGAHALNTFQNKKNIEIDLSRGEYTDNREAKILDGYTIFVYTPLMIIYEKIRASCQQLPEYKINGNKVRARDLFDIYNLIISNENLKEEVENPNNFYILKNMFILKGVSIDLLNKFPNYKETLRRDYQDNVINQINKKKDEIPNFDFLMSYVNNMFQNIFKNIKK